MTVDDRSAELARVKLALSRKYANLGKLTKSRPRKKRLLHHAESYRRQAEDLSRR
jgi:hypothetical protein